MKNFNQLLFASILLTAVFFSSCGKNGAPGPAGPAGSTGQTGATGAVGATGADGTKIYSGAGAPASTLGANGDFYINNSNSNLYGPKTASGWGTPTSLQGATGTPGSKIYSGTGVPPSSLGNNGDYYLDGSNYLFYGPKTGGAWPVPINLKGAQGDPGTANVIYSDWITPSTYTQTTVFGTIYFTADIAASAITQSILDQGAVLVYGKLDGYVTTIWPTAQVSELPITITYMDGTSPNIDTWSGLASVGSIRISLTSSLNAYASISNAHQFRYVIIPGGVHTLGNINTKNYNEVKQALHLNN